MLAGKLPPWALCVSKTCRATWGLINFAHFFPTQSSITRFFRPHEPEESSCAVWPIYDHVDNDDDVGTMNQFFLKNTLYQTYVGVDTMTVSALTYVRYWRHVNTWLDEASIASEVTPLQSKPTYVVRVQSFDAVACVSGTHTWTNNRFIDCN